MTKIESIKENIADLNPEAIIWDGYDDALIGYHRDGKAVYDEDKMIQITIDSFDNSTEEGEQHTEAIEYLEFNVWSAYVGEYTPVHITVL